MAIISCKILCLCYDYYIKCFLNIMGTWAGDTCSSGVEAVNQYGGVQQVRHEVGSHNQICGIGKFKGILGNLAMFESKVFALVHSVHAYFTCMRSIWCVDISAGSGESGLWFLQWHQTKCVVFWLVIVKCPVSVSCHLSVNLFQPDMFFPSEMFKRCWLFSK